MQGRFLGLHRVTGPERCCVRPLLQVTRPDSQMPLLPVLTEFLRESLAPVGQTSALDLDPVASGGAAAYLPFLRKWRCVGLAELADPWSPRACGEDVSLR